MVNDLEMQCNTSRVWDKLIKCPVYKRKGSSKVHLTFSAGILNGENFHQALYEKISLG